MHNILGGKGLFKCLNAQLSSSLVISVPQWGLWLKDSHRSAVAHFWAACFISLNIRQFALPTSGEAVVQKSKFKEMWMKELCEQCPSVGGYLGWCLYNENRGKKSSVCENRGKKYWSTRKTLCTARKIGFRSIFWYLNVLSIIFKAAYASSWLHLFMAAQG